MSLSHSPCNINILLNPVYFPLRKIVKFCTRRFHGGLSVHSVDSGIGGVFGVPVSLFKHEGVLRVAIV